jgi:signal transduction histidine kinase/serine/threonine protein kinase
MIHLPGYDLKGAISETPTSRLYRGHRLYDARPVIVKLPKAEVVTPQDRDRYRCEWQLLSRLDIDGIAPAIDADLDRDRPILVFDDMGGQFLSESAEPLDLTQFLLIASRFAEILGLVHNAKIVHCNISPDSILFEPESETVTLWDFSDAICIEDYSAHELTRTINARIQSPNTLAYVAPEQTGRVNRGIDYRTDFYALGITFFRLLTGRVPFESDDPLDLIHAHIAQASPPLIDLIPTLPVTVSEIVAKLLAKMPEDRYQTAWGLQTDLVLCLIQWEATGEIEPLVLAEHDSIDRLQLPSRLYGREAELKSLAESFREIGLLDRTGSIALKASPKLVLVSGEGGIGKSSLIAESFKPIAPQYGYVLSGRFESSPQELTYTAFVQIAQAFARQLLTETAERVAEWRSRFREALDRDLGALIEIVPDLQLAIDLEPSDLEPASEPSSFLFVLQRFLWTLAASPYPVAVLLDDLQWADVSTLKFLEDLLSAPQTRALVVVGAYRPEGKSIHIQACGSRLRDRGAKVTSIHLTSMNLAATMDLIADALQQTPSFIAPLASLVFQKTDGHPFFVHEFLKTLYDSDLLRFDDESKSWQWDIDQVRDQAITDNVLELMLAKLHQLPQRSQQVLSLGAFLGRTFRLHILAQLLDCSVRDILRDLTPAIIEGLLSPPTGVDFSREEIGKLSGDLNYQFLHDLVRQVAYQLTPATQRPVVHLQIGQMLLNECKNPQSREHLPDLVYHWNAGGEAICEDADRLERARLNLAAALQAKQEGEYAIAVTYCDAGLTALSQVTADLRAIAPNLYLHLNLQRATLDYLQGNLEQSEALISRLLPDATQPDDLAALYSLIVVEQTMRGDYETLWQTLKVGSLKLGISLELDDHTPWPQQIRRWPLTLKSTDLQRSETGTVATHQPICSLLEQAIAPAAIAGRPERLAAIVTQMLAQAPDPTPQLATAYAVGGILFHTCSDVTRARQWLAAARLMSHYCGDPRSSYRMQAIHDIYFAPWHESSTTVLPRLDRLAIDTFGAREVQYSSYIRVARIALGLYGGVAIPDLLMQLADVAIFCQHHHNHWASELTDRLRDHLEALQRDSVEGETWNSDRSGWNDLTDRRDTPKLGATPGIRETGAGSGGVTGGNGGNGGNSKAGKAIEDRSDDRPTPPIPASTWDTIATESETFDTSIIGALDAAHAIQRDYLTGCYDRAIALASRLEGHTTCLLDFIVLAQYQFYWGLAIAARLEPAPLKPRETIPTPHSASNPSDPPQLTASQRKALYDRLQTLDHRFKKRARRGIVEFECQQALISAEIARIDHQPLVAIDHYDRVILLATRHNFDHYNAIANELSARLWIARGNIAVARTYLHEALRLYTRWGCRLKVAEIERDCLGVLFNQLALSDPPVTVPPPLLSPLVSAGATAEDSSTGESNTTLRILASPSDLNRTFDNRPPGEVVFDMETAIKTSQILAGEIELDRLLDKLMQLVLANAGATSGSLSLDREGIFQVVAIEQVENSTSIRTRSLMPIPADETCVPLSLLNYVARTTTSVLLNDVSSDRTFANDPYIQRVKPKSILCSPIQGQGKLLGILYLENVLTAGAFTDDRLGILMLICAQAAIALENAELYNTLRESEQRERERAAELNRSLADLQEAQLQVIQSEKMATLGQLVAGVAHEINNPIGFIDANLCHARGYVDDLLELIDLYQSSELAQSEEIENLLEDIEFEFLRDDLPKLLASMKVGTDRIRQISKSLRTFSRSDTSKPVAVDLHEGLDSTLMILRPRLKFTERRTDIDIIQEYGSLPPVVCYAGQLNQVFTNTIANAIDAFDELADRYATGGSIPEGLSAEGAKLAGCQITITTAINADQQEVTIRIGDNGPGMPPEVRDRIFERLFTTKAVGKGTGLGMSISHQIVVETHKGRFNCESILGEGTVFEIVIPVDVAVAIAEAEEVEEEG